MKLRVHRRHESGASNADQRIRDERQHKLNASEIISRRKANNSFHVTSSYGASNNKEVADKLNSTSYVNEELYKVLMKSKPLYQESKKDVKQRTAISLPRTSHLEEKEKRKRAYVGDSLAHLENPNSKYDFKLNKDDSTNMLSSQIYGSNKKEQDDETLTKIQIFQQGSPIKNRILQEVKHEDNKQAKLETQLVELRENKESVEGQFNIHKINEIKQAIQRKYHHRTNFKNIFQAWDEEGKGAINKKNISNMLSRMGIKCNQEEAQILLSTADKDNSNDLNMQEFLDLVFVNNLPLQHNGRNTRSFSENNKLNNIQLYESLPNLNNNQNQPETSSPELQRKYRKQMQVEDESRNDKNMKIVLKNKITQLLNNFWINDYQQTGNINKKSLQDIIRRKVDLSSSVVSDQEIQQIFKQYSIPNKPDAFDYKQFIKDLKSFNYNETEQKTTDILNESMKQTKTYQNLVKKYAHENPKEFNLKDVYINDIQNDNPQHIDWMKARADKLSKHIQKFFNNQKEFSQYLKQQIQEGQTKEQIHKTDLLSTFKGMFDQTDLKFDKRDYEGIMEMFQYNKHGYTAIEEIPKIIYQEDSKQMYARIAQKIRGPPPIVKQSQNENEDLYNNVTTNSLQVNSMVNIGDHNEKNGIQKFNKQSATISAYQPPQYEANNNNGNHQNRTKRGYSFETQSQQFITQENDSQYTKGQIKNVLKKVEDRLFLGDTRAYQVFKTFDLDKDGYVKKDELNEKLSQMSVLNPEEQKIFNKYVDPNNQGYLNFSQFNGKIHAQMSTQFDKSEYDINPYNQRQIVQEKINLSKTYNSFIDNTRQQFQARSKINTI